jgi:crossover junction endodeoxyribonuclease RuvC
VDQVNKQRILAIDPGTKEVGVAVLEDADLVYYAVKTVRDRSTAQAILQQVAKITRDLVVKFQPESLAIEKMFIVQKSAALLSVAAEEMKSVARSCRLDVYEYSPKAVRKFICQNGAATKREVAQVVAVRYPELKRHLNTRNKWDEKYYANMFDAVAVGLMCRHEVAAKTAA